MIIERELVVNTFLLLPRVIVMLMKKITVVSVAVLAAGGIVFLVVHSLSDHYLTTKTAAQKPAIIACQGTHEIHNVLIKNNQVDPGFTDASLCDTLVITNIDSRQREMAFGLHEHHIPYDGVTEKVLKKDGIFN